MSLTVFPTAPGRSGEQQDVLWRPGVPEAADGGHEVPPAARAPAHVPEPAHQTQEVHGGGAVRRGGHGRLQRYQRLAHLNTLQTKDCCRCPKRTLTDTLVVYYCVVLLTLFMY